MTARDVQARFPPGENATTTPCRGGTLILNTMVQPYYNARPGAHLRHIVEHDCWREDAARPPVEAITWLLRRSSLRGARRTGSGHGGSGLSTGHLGAERTTSDKTWTDTCV